MTDKEAQLKAKLLKMKLAEQKKWSATGLSPEEVQKVRADHEKRRKYMKLDPTKNKNKVTESDFQSGNFEIKDAKGKVNKLKKKYVDPNPQAETPEEIMQSAESAGREPTYIAQEHGHRISFRGHSAGNYKTASLNEQSGKYAKYWLLNAKDTNGNGWGIAAHTAKDNMKKFIGRPLVVTASSWHGASEYGNEYEHPYLPTNDITAILDHQEKFRVGSIVDVVEDNHGDWYANVEMLPKFANSRLPPFCSPAIYQLDASEAEGQISKWEALHLAALTENPAYGARIALLKGTCVGTGSECKVQFKSAKQEATTVCPKKKQKISRLKQRLAYEGGSKYDRQITDLSKNFEEQRDEITKRRPDNLVGRQPKNAFGHVCTNEATCGATSGFLGTKLMSEHGLNHKQVKIEGGMYTGPGGEFASGAFRDNDETPTVGHEWIRLDDGTIIDGSVGQFMDQKNKINQKQRLRVIPPNAPLQKYYKGHYSKNPFLQKREWYDKNDSLKKGIEKYERMMRKGKEDPTEKVIREVKDPEKKKDLLNRLDEKPNEYGPKNYGATKPKNFGKKIGKLKARLAGRFDSNDRKGINIKSTGQMDRSPEANKNRVFPIKKNEFAFMDEVFTTNIPPVRVETFRSTPESALARKNKGKVTMNSMNLKKGRDPPKDSPLGEKLEDAAVERKLFKKRGTIEGGELEGNTKSETFTENFMRKYSHLPTERETPTVGKFSRGTISLNEARKLAKLKQRLYIAQQSKLQKTALSETPLNPKNSFNIRLKKGVKNTLYDPKYVYYNIMANVDSGFVKKNQLGSVQQYIRKNDLSKMRINNPNTGSWNELGEIADIRTGVIEPEDGDVSFQSKGSPGKLYYHDIKPNKTAKLKQKIASPIIQETGEGITFKKVDPKIYNKKTYGYHKIPMHPSNAILIRPKDPEKYMDLVDHFRKIHETHDFAQYTQGSVQKTIPLRSLRNDIRHMSGDPLKRHADISTASGKAFKKGDILMRRVGGTPAKGKYGTVGETYYIEEDSPEGEIFNAPSKYNRRAKLKARLAGIDYSEFYKKQRRYEKENPLPTERQPKGFGENMELVDPPALEKEVPFGIDKRPMFKRMLDEDKTSVLPSELKTLFDNKIVPTEGLQMKSPLTPKKDSKTGLPLRKSPRQSDRIRIIKAKLASLGEQNMTYQDSKKVKIHKKKNMEKHDKS